MTSPGETPESDAEALRAEALGLMRQGRFEDVAALCDRSRDTLPRAGWLRTLGAHANFSLGRLERANALAAESLAMGSGDIMALYVLGVTHGQLGNPAAAALALGAAHDRLPKRLDIAAAYLEQVAAAYGLATARKLFERLSRGNGEAPELLAAWGKAQARAGAPGFVHAPLRTVPAWMAGRGLAFDWKDAPYAIAWEQPAVVGAPDAPRPRGEFLSYAPYVATLPNATIFSKSNLVLTDDGVALNDTLADVEYGRYAEMLGDVAVVERQADRLLLNVGQYAIGEIDAGLHMSGFASEHFGHWTSEYLLRLHSLRHHPRFASLPIIVDQEMPPQHLEYLRLVVDNPIVSLPPHHGLKCRELVVAAPVAFFPVQLRPDHAVPPYRVGPSSAAAFEHLRDCAVTRLPPPGPADRRIYLSRRKRSWRCPTNEEEISAHLQARGFEIVYPEDLTFAEQAQVFREARVMVAPNGSALMNWAFLPAGARTVVLSQRGLFNWALYYAWMVDRGFEVMFVQGPQETANKHDDYTIALSDLDLALDGA